MNRSISRRHALKLVSTATSAVALPATTWSSSSDPKQSPNERPRLGCVGVGGKGWADSNGAAKHGDIVAYADVEAGRVKRSGGFLQAGAKWPKAAAYEDWRIMLEKEGDQLDGITVSTPDHMHAPITMTAIKMGIGTYTQKPMTRTIHEARQITLAAAEAGVATQMGNQHHNGTSYRTLVDVIRKGTIGKIKEAHAWSNRPIWPQGLDRPAPSPEPPATLNWDLWLGIAPERPWVKDAYHPFAWRGWFDFGAGALGDMGCHIIDPVIWALELGPAKTVRYEGPTPKPEAFPNEERLHYTFAGNDRTVGDTFTMVWHDGGLKPSGEACGLPKSVEIPSQGTLFVGEKGFLLTPHGSRTIPALYPEADFPQDAVTVVKGVDHYGDWIEAIKSGGKAASGFHYSGPMTETVLLGTVAARVGEETLEWDTENLRFAGTTAANDFVKQPYRKGWEVEGLA